MPWSVWSDMDMEARKEDWVYGVDRMAVLGRLLPSSSSPQDCGPAGRLLTAQSSNFGNNKFFE
jgi:hypothetical protein